MEIDYTLTETEQPDTWALLVDNLDTDIVLQPGGKGWQARDAYLPETGTQTIQAEDADRDDLSLQVATEWATDSAEIAATYADGLARWRE